MRNNAGKVCRLQHLDSWHFKKTDQIRIASKCTAIFQDQSLKKHFLQGPYVIHRLIDVLLRFGIQQTAVTCDIKEMSHSFHANREYGDLQRFPWFKDNNPNGDIEYRTIAPLLQAVWLFVSRQFWPLSTAESGQDSFKQEPADFLRNDFYVDAGLKVLWYI